MLPKIKLEKYTDRTCRAILDCSGEKSDISEMGPASFHILSESSFTYHPLIRRYIVWVTDKASINKLEINKSTTY
jgi:hypothetical protein